MAVRVELNTVDISLRKRIGTRAFFLLYYYDCPRCTKELGALKLNFCDEERKAFFFIIFFLLRVCEREALWGWDLEVGYGEKSGSKRDYWLRNEILCMKENKKSKIKKELEKIYILLAGQALLCLSALFFFSNANNFL